MALETPPFIVCIWKDSWADAVGSVTLKDVHETHKPTIMELRGWLIYEDGEGVSIATERCIDKPAEQYYRGRSYILKSLIQSITTVNISKPRRKKCVSPPPSLSPSSSLD